MKKFYPLFLFLFCGLVLFSCKQDNVCDDCGNIDPIDQNSDVLGYGILVKLPGIWRGPVSSATALGSFPEWTVDLRPISNNQVSAKNELDSLNDIHLSFFICQFECSYKMAFRNGGGFAGLDRTSYMIVDSVFESVNSSYYRFSDPVVGGKRVYSELIFKGDSLILRSFTNKYNTLADPVLHMEWRSKLLDQTSAQAAISKHSFPGKSVTQNFETTFDSVSEAVFYDLGDDPYPADQQPELGVSNITFSLGMGVPVDPTKRVLIMIMTQELFDGFTPQLQNLIYRSRYVFVPATVNGGFSFDYMHPGTYFVNVIYDLNGDGNFSSGDYMNSMFDRELILDPEGTTSLNVTVDFQIP